MIDIFHTNVELYRRGNYSQVRWYDNKQEMFMSYHPKQIKALEYFNDSTTTYVGYGGAARGGKSLLIASACLFECHVYPGSRYLLGRRDLMQLYGTTWKTMQDLIRDFDFQEGRDFKHDRQKNVVTFIETGSEIVLKNLELQPRDLDATAFGSLEITKAFIDQSENVDLKIISKVGERAGSHLAEKYDIKGKVMECFNPLKQSHTTGRYWIPFKNNREKETIKFVRALPTDNPSPSAKRWVAERTKDYEDGTMSESEYRKQILGDFDQDDNPASLIINEALEQSFHNDHLVGGRKCLVIDLAGSGKDSLAMFVFDNRILIDHLVTADKMDAEKIDSLAAMLIRKHKIDISNIVFDADGMGDLVAGVLKGARRFKNGSTNDKTRSGKYKNLKSYCGFKLAERINEALYWFKNVEEIDHRLRRELPYLQRKSKQNDVSVKEIIPKDVIKKSLGHSPDLLDVCIMHEYLYEFEYSEGGLQDGINLQSNRNSYDVGNQPDIWTDKTKGRGVPYIDLDG